MPKKNESEKRAKKNQSGFIPVQNNIKKTKVKSVPKKIKVFIPVQITDTSRTKLHRYASPKINYVKYDSASFGAFGQSSYKFQKKLHTE